ncbi:hypothetical protein DE146DRAFT_765238 [Phaeosphaeria sp. MPI-PUGE-AT-0046c]|nr:hypothetical protein DE146DRAFT_765238 [Phaeosphaeria sp. MPI-PUGE-AT-0046c]
MSTTTISMQPASKFNWADDDEDDAFDLEAWKATADISAPSAESLPPLQPQDSASSTSTYYTTISPALACAAAPWSDYPPPTPIPSPPTAVLATSALPEEYHLDASATAWRALRDLPDLPAYPELSACKNARQYYAREWSFMKMRSGLDGRVAALYRFSPLREVWYANHEGEVQEVLALVPIEPCVLDTQEIEEVVVVEEDDDLEPFPDFRDYEVAVDAEIVDSGDVEPLVDVSSPTTPVEIEVLVEDGDMATTIASADPRADIENIHIKSPIDTLTILHQAPTENGDISSAITDTEDDTKMASDILDALLLDSDSDSDSYSETSSVSSLSLPSPKLPLTIPMDTLSPSKPRTSCTFTSPSPPLSPTYDTIQIGFSPASTFIKQQQVHKRRDSQEALDHGPKYYGDVRELDIEGVDMDVCDATNDHRSEKALYYQEMEKDHGEEGVVAYVCGKAVEGWAHLSNTSWTTTATVIGVGFVLGGALRAARRC